MTTLSDQFVLDLPTRKHQMQARDFQVSTSNRRAVALVEAWPDWPGPVAVIYGEEGCGKTHLLKVWQARSGARRIDPDQLGDVETMAELVEHSPVLAMDALDAHLPAPQIEEKLFHLINLLREGAVSHDPDSETPQPGLLITAREAPAFWPLELRDLITRLRGAPAFPIDPPDDALLAGVLVKLFTDRQLAVDPKLIDWMLQHTERSFAAARRNVEKLDHAALASKRKLNTRLARDVLQDV